jgi:hypothetical protein
MVHEVARALVAATGTGAPPSRFVAALRQVVPCSRTTAYRALGASLRQGVLRADPRNVLWPEPVSPAETTPRQAGTRV